jgi:hypothetical protein
MAEFEEVTQEDRDAIARGEWPLGKPEQMVASVHGFNPNPDQRRPDGHIRISNWFTDEDSKRVKGENHEAWLKRMERKFTSEAEAIYSVLANNLPGGTLHALLIEMLKGKLCLYTVLDQPDTTIKDIAEKARDFVWEPEQWEAYTDSKESNSVAWPPEWLLLCQAVEKRYGPPPADSTAQDVTSERDNAEPVSPLRRKSDFQETLYNTLREFQEGKLPGDSTGVGALSQELTAVYDAINSAVEKLA